jgi:hypothetical protein
MNLRGGATNRRIGAVVRPLVKPTFAGPRTRRSVASLEIVAPTNACHSKSLRTVRQHLNRISIFVVSSLAFAERVKGDAIAPYNCCLRVAVILLWSPQIEARKSADMVGKGRFCNAAGCCGRSYKSNSACKCPAMLPCRSEPSASSLPTASGQHFPTLAKQAKRFAAAVASTHR